MEEELCTENHKNSHIYITEGYSKASSPAGERWNEKAAETEKKIDRREAKEIQEFRENCRRQRKIGSITRKVEPSMRTVSAE